MSFVDSRLRGWRERALTCVSPLLLLLSWEWACRAGLFPEQLLVSPGTVADAFMGLVDDGELQSHLQASLHRLLAGFLAGSALGLAFGVLMGLSRTAENICSPLFNVLRQVPSVAFIPMLILAFGIEETFKIVIVAKAAFFPVALAAYDAVRGIPRSHLEVAKVYRLPLPAMLRRIVLPATVPPVLTGLRLGLGRSWMVLVVAELLAADSGIGQMMEMGRQMFRIDVVMVGVMLTGVIGFVLDRGFRVLEARLVRWRRC